MKTEVVMKRRLFGLEISQKSKSEFLSATDIAKAGNAYRLSKGGTLFTLNNYWKLQSTQDFIATLESEFNEKVKSSEKGRGKHTWVHPILAIDIALAIDPMLKLEVYKWMYDLLLKYRNDSGDSYKKMVGALYENAGDKRNFQKAITKTAQMIQNACGVNNWQYASEEQLKLRDKIHNNIALLCSVLRNNNKAVILGIKEAKK